MLTSISLNDNAPLATVSSMHLLKIDASPRGSKSNSIALTDAFVTAYRDAMPSVTVDAMNVWDERLPEFDNAAIDAKYKGVAGSAMNEAETRVWNRIQALVVRFKRADRIVLGVPMWNFAYPYKLKQLIDLVSQRNMLFTYDGKRFGPLLQTPRAMVIYTRGQEYREDLPTRLPGSTTNQAMSSSGSVSSGCKTFEHWRLRTRGAIKPKPACGQRERKWQGSPKLSNHLLEAGCIEQAPSHL